MMFLNRILSIFEKFTGYLGKVKDALVALDDKELIGVAVGVIPIMDKHHIKSFKYGKLEIIAHDKK